MTSLPDIPRDASTRALELPRPTVLSLAETAPSIEEIFAFMREAERRFRTLRMRIVERSQTAAGTAVTTIELWLAHPGRAKVIENRPIPGEHDGDNEKASYWVWVSDGERVRTYDSATKVATDRAHRHIPDEISDPSLPAFARIVPPITELPMESLPEAFVHPAGLAHNLATGRVALVGQSPIGGRESLILQIEQPRTSLIEADRPDRSVILGVDRESGVVTLLEERFGDSVARRAEATYLEPNAPIRDDVFTIHVPSDAIPMF